VSHIRIYFEGTAALRPALGSFIEKALPLVCGKLRLTAGGGRDQAIDAFVSQVRQGSANILLLIDSEEADDGKLYARLSTKQNWRIPRGRNLQKQVCWMVQCMETWFIADRAALRGVFKRNLNERALPPNPKVEEVAKDDVLRKLKNATRGGYEKGAHAQQILRLLDPGTVRNASQHCQRFFEVIAEQVGR